MKKRLLTLGVTAAVVAASVLYLAPGIGAASGFTITADVERAPNLFAGARVMIRGVQVGRISTVEPRADAVRLTMEIDEDVKIPADAELSVIPITVVSDRYVQFTPAYASGPMLEGGDHLDLERTSVPAELDEVVTQLQELLGALEAGPGEERGPLAELVIALDEATVERGDDLAGAIENSAVVLENLADSQNDIQGLIRNLDQLFVGLAARSSDIGLLNEKFEDVAVALSQDQQHLERMLENITFLSSEGERLVDESGEELGVSLKRLDRVLRVVLEHQDSLVDGMRWTNVLSRSLGATDASGRGRFAYSGLQAPVGGPGAEYNYRIDTRDTIGCQRILSVERTLSRLFLASAEDVRVSILSHIPDQYDPHIVFLVNQLIPLCVPRFSGVVLTSETQSILSDLEATLGRNELRRLLEDLVAQGASR